MKGRKALPNKLVELRGGTAYTHRKARRTDLDLPPNMPKCPDFLDKIAKKEWKRAGKALYDLGILTELDRSILAAYCESYSRWVYAAEKLQTEGMVFLEGRKIGKDGQVLKEGIPRVSPYVKILKDAQEQMVRAGTLLGMNPSARASLSIQPRSTESNKYEQFLMMKHGKSDYTKND